MVIRMIKRKIAFLLVLCLIFTLWTVPAKAGEKPNTSAPETSQENSAETPAPVETSQPDVTVKTEESGQPETSEKTETGLEKGWIDTTIRSGGEMKEGKIAVLHNTDSDQLYLGLSSLCQMLDMECDLRPQYAEVTDQDRCFDFYKDSCEVAFVGFTAEPVYDLEEPALFDQKDGKTREVWVLPEALTELLCFGGVVLGGGNDLVMTADTALLIYPEIDEEEVIRWLDAEKPNAELQIMDSSILLKLAVFQQAVDYEAYLKEVLIPEKGLAAEISQQGILSADIRDYNADGVEDLLVLELVETGFDGTFIQLMALAEYGKSTPGRKCFAIKASFYTLEASEITMTDEYPVQMISENYTGKMKVHLVQMEDTWYLSANSSWEDWNTVGDNFYCPTIVLSVDSNGRFEINSVYGTLSFGQHGASVHPEVLDMGEEIDFKNTIVQYGASKSAEGRTLLCEVEILRDAKSFTFTDHTSLRQALEEGFDAVEPVRGNIDAEYQDYLKQQEQNQSEEERRVSAFTEMYGTQLEDIRNYVAANAGAGLTEEEIKIYFPTDHRIALVLSFDSSVYARFFFEEENGELLSAEVEVTGKNENKQAWVQLKDAVLTCPALPFGPYQQYLGNINYASDEASIPGWRLSATRIDRWLCHIDKLSN